MTQGGGEAGDLAVRLLDRLLVAASPESVESLALRLGADAPAIVAAVETLRRCGCEFHRDPHLGLRLVRSGINMWSDYLRWTCPGRSRQRILEVYRTTTSTQDAASRILRAAGEKADAAVVVAQEQIAGRGRLGRRWHTPAGKGAMLSHVTLAPRGADPVRHANWSVLAAAVAVTEALLGLRSELDQHPESAVDGATMRPPRRTARQAALPLVIKWPNDILVETRKLAGILVETQPVTMPDGERRTAMVVGVGINVTVEAADLKPLEQTDPALATRVTSLAMQGMAVDPLLVLARVIYAFDHFDPRDMLARWRAHSTLSSQWIHVRSAGRELRGQVIDLDPYEGLILRTSDGVITPLPAATTTIL